MSASDTEKEARRGKGPRGRAREGATKNADARGDKGKAAAKSEKSESKETKETPVAKEATFESEALPAAAAKPSEEPENKWIALAERYAWVLVPALLPAAIVAGVLQGPQADIRARIEFGAMGEQQRAGLSLFGVRVPWIGVLREAGVTYLAYANAGVEVRGQRLDGQTVILRAEVKQDQTVQFSYSLSETAPFQPFQPLGPVTPLATFSWWKGSRPAVFTYIKSDIDEPRAPPGTIKHVITHNYVDVDWFRVSPGNSTQP
jgi:hypothetical protein